MAAVVKKWGVKSDSLGQTVGYFDIKEQNQKQVFLHAKMKDAEIKSLLRNGFPSTHFVGDGESSLEDYLAKINEKKKDTIFKKAGVKVAKGYENIPTASSPKVIEKEVVKVIEKDTTKESLHALNAELKDFGASARIVMDKSYKDYTPDELKAIRKVYKLAANTNKAAAYKAVHG